ncbi:hypothetical protein [Emcibacter sp.]|uniref:hypothetical protein n=1 Tax=Emcibacter sp. TaxID=1979954 RepID=UPI003A8F67C9
MINIDPSSPAVDDIAGYDQELSIEDISAIEESNQMTSPLLSPGEGAGAIQAGGGDVHGVSEESQGVAGEGQGADAAVAKPVKGAPIPLPLPVRSRRVSGCYSNCPKPWKLELRVDVDGRRPLRMVSGDYFYKSGSTTSYFGSFKVKAPTIKISNNTVVITGIAETTWNTSYRKIVVQIPRHNIYQPAANAYVQWLTLNNKKGAQYVCTYDSAYFRKVELEQDHEESVTPFVSYNTGALPSGGSARTLTVAKAYGEAGVEVISSGVTNQVPTSAAGANHQWSNAELHDAMEANFSLWQDVPHWKVWLFHARAHEYGTGLLGIMYDQKDKQRQGCASFYQNISSGSAADQRTQVYVNVHELGHCFNLFHSFHKTYMDPPLPNRPDSLSWMNYPQNYPGGAATFWSNFDFQFDTLEVTHLRHAYRNDVIFGGNPFGKGAAAEDHLDFMGTLTDDSGLSVSVEAHHADSLGTPVYVTVKVENTSSGPKAVFKDLDPASGLVQILIRKPDGAVLTYKPPMCNLIVPESKILKPGEALKANAFIGLDGEDGLIFETPGMYQLVATYYAEDGSAIVSPVQRVNIKAPRTEAEDNLADLMLGHEQGMQFFLEGSPSSFLKKGDDAFQQVLEEYPEHPIAAFVGSVEGLKSSRDFVQIDLDHKVKVKRKDQKATADYLSRALKNKGAQNKMGPELFGHFQDALSDVKGKGKKEDA